MDLRLQGKVCLVTGAGKGIGKEIALSLLSEGATVYANTRTEEAFDALSAEAGDRHKGVLHPAVFDITDREAVSAVIRAVKKEEGRIDILVNNAGIVYNERLGMISPDHAVQMMNTNVLGLIELTQQVCRLMMRERSGAVVNITSAAAIKGDAFQTAYTASKGAVISFTKSAALELAPHGIRVNAVAPGLTNTGMLKEGKDEKIAERIEKIPLGRIAEPRDIANAVLFLASDAASYITGEILSVSGGA